MSLRVHEWSWGDVGRRTVCGLGPGREIVINLGAVEVEQRCRNCERMRAATGTSSRGEVDAPAPTVEIIELAAARAATLGVSDREIHIMQHATGWLSRWPLYRNHFCAGPGHDDFGTIQGLIVRGLMRVSREPSPLSGGDTVFCVTAIGIAALKGSSRRTSGGASSKAE